MAILLVGVILTEKTANDSGNDINNSSW